MHDGHWTDRKKEDEKNKKNDANVNPQWEFCVCVYVWGRRGEGGTQKIDPYQSFWFMGTPEMPGLSSGYPR